jgi:ATP10 protein
MSKTICNAIPTILRNTMKDSAGSQAYFRIAVLLLTAAFASAQDTNTALPRLEGESLSGNKVVLPTDAHGKITLLVIGFSRKGGDATHPWAERFKKDFADDPKVALYSVAELEGAPRFIRGIIVSSMKKGTPEADRSHVVTLFQDTDELKQFVKFSAGDDAYLLLLDANGKVGWHSHGIFREDSYTVLQTAARKLAAQ